MSSNNNNHASIRRQQRSLFSMITDKGTSDAAIYNEIDRQPNLLLEYAVFFPVQDVATLLINTKRYQLLLKLLNSSHNINLEQMSYGVIHSKVNRTKICLPGSTPLFAVCSQYDPIYTEIRAEIIKAMVNRNPNLVNIPNRNNIYPAEICLRNQNLLSLLALGITKDNLARYYGVHLYSHNPYAHSQRSNRTEETL